MKRNFGVKFTGLSIATVLFTSVLLSGCGSASKETGAYESDDFAATAEYAQMADMDMSEGNNATQVTENGAQAQASRKLITTVDISAETREYDSFLASVDEQTQKAGGYIQSSSLTSEGNRRANYCIRIPADRLNVFLSGIDSTLNITSKNTNVEDVTLSYVDMDSHRKELKAEEERLLSFMEQAETVEDMMAIEERLTDCRYQRESIESQLRTFDNQVNYSTVNLSVREVIEYTIEPETVGERISKGFSSSLRSTRDFLVDIFVALIVCLPQLFVFAIFVLAIVVIVLRIDKNSKKKKEIKMTQAAENGAMMATKVPAAQHEKMTSQFNVTNQAAASQQTQAQESVNTESKNND